MRVQTEEWRRFIPGVRMYKGKMTLFYNGETLFDREDEEPLIYTEEKRQKWEVIIVLPGVRVIHEWTFIGLGKVESVIMADDSVRRIDLMAFQCCNRLVHVKLSRNLEYMEALAFAYCESLPSMFIPPSCREIGEGVFTGCKKLLILNVSHQTQLGEDVIAETALIEKSPFPTDIIGSYENHEVVNEWIQNHLWLFSLHRACASYNPSEEVILEIIRRDGVNAFKKKDNIGVTASQYLSENPFTEIKEHNIIKRYILDMAGEVI